MTNHVLAPHSLRPLFRLEAELLKLPQIDMPVEHEFCAGLYARTMHIPSGAVLTGAIHRHDCFFVVRHGVLLVSDGGQSVELSAGDMRITPAGSKRAGVALTDVVVTTFHANPDELRDACEIWQAFTIPAPQIGLGVDQMELIE
jgi:hypothetical protein